MKKLKLLVILTFATLIVFSQPNTNNTTKSKDTTISLPKSVAREVVKDLLKGESTAVELSLVKQNYNRLETNLVLKDSIIKYKDLLVDLYKEYKRKDSAVISLKDSQIKDYKNLSEKLNKDLKKEKRKRTFWNITGSAIIAGMGYLLLTK